MFWDFLLSRRGRWSVGLLFVASGVLLTGVVNRLAPDDTTRMARTYMAAGLSLTAVYLWWILWSGVKLVPRIVIAVLVPVGLVAMMQMGILGVTFDGDMRPRFRFFGGSPSPSERSQKWLAENAPTLPATQDAGGDTESVEITGADWPRYCGADGSREIREPHCSFDWKTRPPRELWRRPVGDAWSSFSVADNRVYTQEQRGTQECVVCYHRDTGEELWRCEDTARYETTLGAVGPRATPTVTPNAVYSLGATGILNSLHPVTGARLWRRNICEDAGSEMVEWGMSSSPLIYGDMLIVDAGGFQGRAVLAYNKDTGDIEWASDSHQAGYMSPRIETIGGQLHLLIFHGDGLAGFDPDTGKKLWEYPWTNQYKINVAQPMLFGDSIFLSSGYESGCVLIRPATLTGGKPAEVWARNKNMKLKFNEAVQRDNYVYGLDDGILACLDVTSGQRKWKGGRYRFGQVLIWNDKLVVQAEAGYVAIVEASPEKFTEVARLDALDDRTWNVPVVNRGRLFVRNAAEAACYELPSADEKSTSL